MVTPKGRQPWNTRKGCHGQNGGKICLKRTKDRSSLLLYLMAPPVASILVVFLCNVYNINVTFSDLLHHQKNQYQFSGVNRVCVTTQGLAVGVWTSWKKIISRHKVLVLSTWCKLGGSGCKCSLILFLNYSNP